MAAEGKKFAKLLQAFADMIYVNLYDVRAIRW